MQTTKSGWGTATHVPVPQSDDYEPFQFQDSQLPKRESEKGRFWSRVGELWLLEISCLVLSVAALAALIVILRKYEGRRIEEWPWSITPNSVLAVFSTIIKAMALLPVADCLGQLKWTWFARGKSEPLSDFERFDSASRGIIGSLGLLVRLRFMHIASLGAFITIIAIAVDPLTQQAITQPTRSIPVPGIATIPRAERYEIPAIGLVDPDGYPAAPNSLVGSLYIGLYTPLDKKVEYPMPVCSTGNCTWPAYSSLGICTQTKEVTDLRDKVCEPCKGKNLTVAAKQCHRACDMPSTFLNVTALKSNTLQKYSTSGIPTNVSTSLAFPEIEWPIADVMMAYRNNFSFIGDESNRTFESIFYFCVQEFETKETNGRFETVMTKVGARTSNKTINDGANARVDESPQLTVRLENRDEPAFVIEPEAVFSVSTAMWQAFKGGMGFDGVVTPTSEVGRVLGTIVDQGPKQSERKPNQYDKLPGIMENIAIAMSNDLKQTPGNGTAVLRHEGTAYSLEIYIKVTWPWLSLLFVTVLLSILLLAMTMIRSMSTRTRVWKTSSLPVLQILSQGVRGDMGVPNRVGASEERAEVRVELEQRQGGWSLVDRRREG